MSKRGLTAERARGELQSEASAALRSALHETDIDQLALADAAGIDPALVSRMSSRACSNTWTGVDLVAWLRDDETRPLALRLVQWIATQTGLDVREAGAGAADPHAMIREACDVIRTVTVAMADGKIEPHEAREILSEFRDFDRTAEPVKAHCLDVIAADVSARGLS